ncbi:alpha-amylase [Rhodoferax sp. AJA081-3]|uniref:alpha-amylase family glycosyl hydrolase n=1 Tax=Rhodoferax sp. AJA081-3 TaxID=2752316 RepID=UPI001ADFDC00|nr:alpha-amylase family glycosyl hydrolase [Rhodoferax sp. AJA081-3]QTN29381.1 alpha-amylase [Rhodoferax sp. AJA081-3]
MVLPFAAKWVACQRGLRSAARSALLLAGLCFGAASFAIDTSPVLAAIQPSTLPTNWQRGAFMEIFVRAYKDSDGDGVGDLKGLTQQLDYLKDLGVTGIWLMPITTSADGDHGYATTDFRGIDPAYGSLEDFDELLRQAHARGIGVVMDYVINHSARHHPMFISALKDGPASPFYDWFVWEKDAPQGWDIWGKNPWTRTHKGHYFGTFGKHMPDFNFMNPAVLAYHQDSLRFWLNRGLDGFRLDAVPHLVENSAKDWNDQPESRSITGELRALITAYSQRHVVCEATANPQVYAAADICGSAFAFGLERNLVKAAKGDKKAIRYVADYFTSAPQTMATFAANHDIFAGARLWDQLRGNLAQYKLAAASYLLQPGTPFIYYGEEIGMAGIQGLDGDEPLRAPMSWTSDKRGAGFTTSIKPFRPIAPNVARYNVAAQLADPNSLLSFYKSMLALRNTLPSLASGSYDAPVVQGGVMAYRRTLGAETTLVVVNYDTKASKLALKDLQPMATLVSAYPAKAKPVAANARGGLRLSLPAQSVQVYRLQP